MKNTLKFWTTLLTIALIVIPLGICGGLLFFYLRDELENRRMISFMNFEQLGHRFDRSLDQIDDYFDDEGSLKFTVAPLALLSRKEAPGVVAGQIPEGFDFKSAPSTGCDIQNVSNRIYILCPILLPKSSYLSAPLEAGYYYAIWRLPAASLQIFSEVKPSRVFMVNSRGKIIYQSDARQPQAELLHKPFVQEYIRLPLSKEATAPYTEMDQQVLGFAMNLHHSNLTLFAESPASIVFAALWKPTTYVFAALFFSVALLALLGRFIIATIREQIDALSTSLQEFTTGHQIPTQHNPDSYLTDFSPLVAALNKNTLQLREMLDAGSRKPVIPPSEPEVEIADKPLEPEGTP